MVAVSGFQIELLAGGVGVALPLWVAAAAFALSQVVGSASSLPFGIGPADAVLIAFLVHAGTGSGGALAITLLTRLAVTVPLGLAGAAAYLRLSHGGRGPRAVPVTAADRGRVAVVGGAGFIGTHVVERLARAGWEVLVIDDLSHPCGVPLPAEVELVEATGGSAQARAALARFRPEALVHLAAKGGVNRALRDPAGHIRSVLAEFGRLLRRRPGRRVRGGGDRVVRRAPCTETRAVLPASERLRPAPRSAYGAEKLCEETYLATIANQGVRTLALRYGNVYGPRQDGTGEAGVVAITATRLIAGRPAVIFGDGLQTRDFVYVEDVADATVAALREPPRGRGQRRHRQGDLGARYRRRAGRAHRLHRGHREPARRAPARCAAPRSMHRGHSGG